MDSLRSLIPSPSGLFAFEAAARHGSFTRAAEELGVTQAAISYSIRQLETALGVTLFHRRHRGIALTENGERFFHDLAIGLAHIRRSAETLKRQRGDRHVTLSASTAFAGYWMVPRLAQLREAHPEIDLRLQTSDKDVDLRAEGISLGVRLGDGEWPAYEAALIAREEIFPVCSPALLEGPHPLNAPEDLRHYSLLHVDWTPFMEETGDWKLWLMAAGLEKVVDVSRGPRFSHTNLALQAAVHGQGVVIGSQALAGDDLAAGRLVRPFGMSVPVNFCYFVVTTPAAARLPKVAAFKDWLLAEAAGQELRGNTKER